MASTSAAVLTDGDQRLLHLLDLTRLKTISEISERFRDIAQVLLYESQLCVEYEGTTTEFQLLEVEFYLHGKDIHEDPFCHGHNDQRIPGQWYFHRAGKPSNSAPNISSTDSGGYRGGTRKGLDLTFGSAVEHSIAPANPSANGWEIRGGILLRSMRLVGSKKVLVVSGPCLVVDKILALTSSRNIAELISKKLSGSLGALRSMESSSKISRLAKLYLKSTSSDIEPALRLVHCSPRIGLDLSHPSAAPHPKNLRAFFIGKLYRFFIHSELLKVNGKCHTLVGLIIEEFPEGLSKGLQSLIDGPIRPILADRRMELAIKSNTFQRYISDLIEGFSKRSLSEFVGPPGKNASSNPQSFMRMMGVLARMGLLE